MISDRTKKLRHIAQTPKYLKTHISYNGRIETIKYLNKFFNWSIQKASIYINKIVTNEL